MGAGVGDRVGHKVLRQIWIVEVSVKSELQNPRARQLKLIAQCMRRHLE